MAEPVLLDRDAAIATDMAWVSHKCTEEEIQANHKQLIQVKLSSSKAKTVLLQLGFPNEYPKSPLFIEVKGKTLPTTLVIKLRESIEAAIQPQLGHPQCQMAIDTLRGFVYNNMFLSAFEELNTIRRKLVPNKEDVAVNQKKGILKLHLKHPKLAYYLDVVITVGNDYPEEAPKLELKGTNFIQSFSDMFIAQTRELARQCVEPPRLPRKGAPPFKVRPSLLPMVQNLVENGVHRYPDEMCPLCKKKLFPENPDDQVDDADDSRKGDRMMRIYCGHLYHFRCIDKYMKTPPFKDGKDCKGKFCGKKIYHKQWTSDVALAEKRWAHLEARKRELEEVAEFLNIADEFKVETKELE